MAAKKQSSNGKSFPHKLYALLDSASDKDFAHIISWQAGGKSFRVHQPKSFVKSILPVYFKQSKFKSFLRQLNIYGFQRIQYGPNKGGYTHQHLLQGVPELCLMIRRVSAPDSGKAPAAISGVPTNLSSTTRKRASATPSTINVVPFKDEQILSPSKGSLGSFDSLGSLGSLGMNGPENNFDLCGTQNEPFHMACDGLSSFLGSSGSLGLSSKTSCTTGSGQQNEPFPLKDDISAFGKPFLERNLSLISNISFGSFSNSSSTSSHQGVRMNVSELDLFKDLFKESDLEYDVPMLFPSYDEHSAMLPRHRSSTHGNPHHNSVFDYPAVSRSRGSGKHFGPEYVTSNGFLEKKPGCLEPSMDELLSLVTANSERNEDLNRSEAVFPTKLHRMLQDAKREGFDHIVSWIHGGTAFKVHDIPLFMEKIMPIYFDQSKFESFRRQLNLYGFTRVTKGPSRGMYYHQDFVQNDSSLCQNITRPKSLRKRKTQPSNSNIRAGAWA